MDFYKLHYILLAYKIFCKYSFDLKIIINIRAFGEKMISRFIILVNMLWLVLKINKMKLNNMI